MFFSEVMRDIRQEKQSLQKVMVASSSRQAEVAGKKNDSIWCCFILIMSYSQTLASPCRISHT